MLIPGMPMMIPSAAGVSFIGELQMTAGEYGSFFTETGFRSGYMGVISGNTLYSGYEIEGIYHYDSSGTKENRLRIEYDESGGYPFASSIIIDGTEYALTLDETTSNQARYIFGPTSSLFSDGRTYEITVT